MDDDPFSVVLLATLPADLRLTLVGSTRRGPVALATAHQLALLRAGGIAFVELFATGNDYAAAMVDLERADAQAMLEQTEERALAALSDDERGRFTV
jgi:hypothetical protein